MNVIVILLTVLQLVSAFLLIGIILIQQSKAGGGLGAMGGGTTETVFGATAGNVLTKGTVILASIFLGCALLVQVINAKTRPTESVSTKLQSEAKADDAAMVADESAADATVTDDVKPEAEGAATSDATTTEEAPKPAEGAEAPAAE
jgi:preprotein translocase subunit SecG